MVNAPHQVRTSDDGFFLHEAYVVWEIASQDARAMWQNTSLVHMFGASLYRFRDSNLTLAKELRVTVYHIRNWSMKNLSTTNSFGRSYQGDIDFDYTVERRNDERGTGRLHVLKVRKPPKSAPPPFTDHTHPPGGGKLITAQRNDPVASELWATSMKTTLEFAQEIHTGSEPLESPGNMARRFLLALLSVADVQTCLNDIGYSVDELRGKLGELG